MARKFNSGDRVKVIRNVLGDPMRAGVSVGHRGRITDYRGDITSSYEITRRNGASDWFSPRELELVKKG